jgi:thiosulfate/3-mercaptopyruvate sulfurtransferase
MAIMRRSRQAPGRSGAGLSGLAAAALATWLPLASAHAAGAYANPQLIIETEELARTLDAPGTRIVDLRADAASGEAAYRAGHVPRAVYLPVRELDDPAANAEGLPIRPEAASRVFGRLGIDHATTVIAYDDGGGVLAARLFFVLEYFGHARVRVLNGGLGKWRREGRPLATAIPIVAPRRFEPQPRRELVATAEEVRAALGSPQVCLIDARSPAEFAGTDARAARVGHVPGAANVDWTATVKADGTFKDADALRALFEAAGLRPGRTAIVYCQSGARASQDYLALRLLGHPRIRNYDGSWMEWGNTPALPVEK